MNAFTRAPPRQYQRGTAVWVTVVGVLVTPFILPPAVSPTRIELASVLGERWPDRYAVSLSCAIRHLLPLVQVPPRGILGQTGPATIATWSRLIGIREIIDRLRPPAHIPGRTRSRAVRRLRRVAPGRGYAGPAALSARYDNAVLSHADRTRIVPAGRRVRIPPGNGGAVGTFLVDGYLRGTWKIVREAASATLTIEPDTPLAHADRAALELEGSALLRFAAAEAAGHDVLFVPAP